MPRGSGFVHLNTPAAISYSPGEKVSLSELRQAPRREQCVVLPHAVGIWRAAFRSYVRAEGLSQFVGDIEAEREGEGPILPPLRAPAAAASSSTSKQRGTQEKDPQQKTKSSDEKGIMIISCHKLSGELSFVYPDHDGVLSSGVVPQVVVSEEEQAEIEMDKKHYVLPDELPDEEREALEELQSLWKSRASSRSEQGAKHRTAVGSVVPSMGALEEENERGNDGGSAKRSRMETRRHELNTTENQERNTGDMLDDALRLAEDILGFS